MDLKCLDFTRLGMIHHLLLDCRRLLHSKSRTDWEKLRPLIHKRMENRSKEYPVKSMIPVAYDVLHYRNLLFHGVSSLIHVIPLKSCKFCREIHIGIYGHQILSCRGYRRSSRRLHEWVHGGLTDILPPVESFHLHDMFQDVIKHDERFDFERIPAVLELCSQAGADISSYNTPDDSPVRIPTSVEEVKSIAQETLDAWENMRVRVKQLMMVYPVKVCEHCPEVHVGPSGHKARMCGVFKFESWRGAHFWKAANVDVVVLPKIVWHRRPQDPEILRNDGRQFYGRAPAVVELSAQCGAVIPKEYSCMMKTLGLTHG